MNGETRAEPKTQQLGVIHSRTEPFDISANDLATLNEGKFNLTNSIVKCDCSSMEIGF